MLRAKELSRSLKRVSEKDDDTTLQNILLIDDDGAILGAANPTDSRDEHCSAVLASIYNEYKAAEKCMAPGDGCLKTVIFNTESSKVVVRELFEEKDQIEHRILLAVLGEKDGDGMLLQRKLEVARVNLQCLREIFLVPSG
ncbi:unnamed protein product [Amoebophrya sp. A120]|nr:unnamed protein product [Amoebophrya sp. A120]|eukprot:GSA120T00006577001.1